jgi:hypothetical protein
MNPRQVEVSTAHRYESFTIFQVEGARDLKRGGGASRIVKQDWFSRMVRWLGHSEFILHIHRLRRLQR